MNFELVSDITDHMVTEQIIRENVATAIRRLQQQIRWKTTKSGAAFTTAHSLWTSKRDRHDRNLRKHATTIIGA
ncbi:MAG: hypothetical protein H6668_24275 [Ardenticatenaceae bacterium]|nr:hypothetical protein [Ardenticatenaceae bacterium]